MSTAGMFQLFTKFDELINCHYGLLLLLSTHERAHAVLMSYSFLVHLSAIIKAKGRLHTHAMKKSKKIRTENDRNTDE